MKTKLNKASRNVTSVVVSPVEPQVAEHSDQSLQQVQVEAVGSDTYKNRIEMFIIQLKC